MITAGRRASHGLGDQLASPPSRRDNGARRRLGRLAQSGNNALANVALDRALSDNPRYTMAQLLRQAIDSGAPPSLARIPMSPEEVAASYDALEADEADRDEERESGEDIPNGTAANAGTLNE